MGYALLIIEPVGQREARTEEQGRALYQRMLEFGAELQRRGLLTLSQSLKSDHGLTRVTAPGRASVVDGPYAEAKEMIGGLFLLSCATREEAVAIARACPAAEWATIEVRELGPCFT